MEDTFSEKVLREQGLRLFQLYALFGNPTSKWDLTSDEVQAILPAHVAFLRGIEADGRMFMGGPFRAPDYEWNGSGLMFVRAANISEATQLANNDPFVIAGLRTYDVKGWQLNEGKLHFSVELDSNKVGIS